MDDAERWRLHRAAMAMSGMTTSDTGTESDVYECSVVYSAPIGVEDCYNL